MGTRKKGKRGDIGTRKEEAGRMEEEEVGWENTLLEMQTYGTKNTNKNQICLEFCRCCD